MGCAVLLLPAPVHARTPVGLVGGARNAINEVQPAGLEGQNVGEETDPRFALLTPLLVVVSRHQIG